MRARTIFHLDMDAFFVSVEELDNPELKGKPVVVGGRANERGVVSAASYAARKFGVHSAMPLRTAHQLCPKAIFIPGRPERYRHYSQRVYEILNDFSPLVEMVSIDEAYLDLTGSERLLGQPLAAADRLHERVRAGTNLACSIGVGTSRLIAKISSDLAKPNGIFWVQPGCEAELLAPLDIGKVPGVGKVTQKGLRDFGIHRIGQLSKLDPRFLEENLGKMGLALAGKARGLDSGAWFEGAIGSHDQPKSVSHETTFTRDTLDTTLLEATLAKLSQLVGRRLREYGLFGHTIQLKLRYSDFSTITRSRTLEEATQLDTVIRDNARDLFRTNWDPSRAIRLVGVHVGLLQKNQGQLPLLGIGRHKKWSRAMEAADRLRDRFGEGAVGLAAAMKHGRRERVHENPASLPGRRGDSSKPRE